MSGCGARWPGGGTCTGTKSDYQMHWETKTPACPESRAARNAYDRRKYHMQKITNPAKYRAKLDAVKLRYQRRKQAERGGTLGDRLKGLNIGNSDDTDE